MKGFDIMTNLEKAVRQSFEEWSDKIDAEIEKAETPPYTEEEMRERARKIWELTHSGKEC